MLNFALRRVFLCRKPVDMRKAFDSLADIVRIDLAMDPFLGDMFVFVGKDRTRAKILVWESSGFWLCAKRLETAHFRLPTNTSGGASTSAALPLNTAEITALLEELSPRMLHRESQNTLKHIG